MASSTDNTQMQPATCTLVIDDFNNCTTSSPFSSPSDSDTSFVLCMNPCIDMNSTVYWNCKSVALSLFLFASPNGGRITVQYRMSIVNAKAQKCHTQDGQIKYRECRQFRGQYILSRDDLFNAANGWLVNDTLTVYCEVYLTDLDQVVEAIMPPSSMSQDYGSLFECGKLSDLVLVASGGTQFKVHKAILCARSAVFSAMFSHDTKEKQSNRIVVEDVSGETCHELLRYIYSDKVDNLKENALELMAAADKYQLNRLKSICEKYLCANLSTESVVITLVMADMYRAEDLKAKCFEYICDNAPDVKNTEEWKSLATKSDLFTQVFMHLFDKQTHKQL